MGRHCGTVWDGVLEEAEGADNYLAEMAAQMDALEAEPEGGRLVIITDASSPIAALLRFQRLHDRRRQDRYMARWLEQWEALLRRHEAIVVLLQPDLQTRRAYEYSKEDLVADLT